MDRDEGLRVLAASPWLSRTPVEFRDTLLSSSRWRKLEAGALVTLGGEEASDVIGMASGVVEFSTVFGASDTPMLTLGHAAYWLGYGPFISGGQPRRATAVARTEVFAAIISPASIHAVLARRPEWWQHFLPLSLEYGDTMVMIAADLLIRDSERRCGAALLRFAGARLPGPRDAGPIEVQATHEELAANANLSRNSTGTILRKFGKAGLVETDYGRIVLTDAVGLRRLVNRPTAQT